jgi:hypothetical protein
MAPPCRPCGNPVYLEGEPVLGFEQAALAQQQAGQGAPDVAKTNHDDRDVSHPTSINCGLGQIDLQDYKRSGGIVSEDGENGDRG